jgi:endonuclease-3
MSIRLLRLLHSIAMAATNPLDQPLGQRRRSARIILKRLHDSYPEMKTALDFEDPWQLLVSTVLSAQTTDENVNRVTPGLFERWPTCEDLAAANPEEVEQVVYSTGFYRQKTKSIIALAADIVEKFGGEVPRDLNAMVTLRGVGRKTASVVLAEVWGDPAIAVDTHVKRVTRRLGLTSNSAPDKIEADLKDLYLEKTWSGISMRFIQFGRDVCDARAPRCWECPLRDRCPYEPKARRPRRQR